MEPSASIWMIPERVHVIWLGPRVPSAVDQLVAQCQELSPGFEVTLWRDDDIGQLRNESLFQSEPTMSGKADIARYEILNLHGGIYLDADFEVLQSLSPIIQLGQETGVVVARESRTAFNNAFIASAPGHPLIERIVQGLRDSARDYSLAGPVARMGPLYLTESIANFISEGGKVTELPQSWIYPYHYDRPDLARKAVPASTLLRHDWATVGDKWSTDLKKSATAAGWRRGVTSVATSVARPSPSLLISWLSSRPEPHILRDSAYGAANRWLFAGMRRSPFNVMSRQGRSTDSADSGIDANVLPNSVLSPLARAVRSRVKGSATFVDVGLVDPDVWRLASRRIDRSGHSIKFLHAGDQPFTLEWPLRPYLDSRDTSRARGSRTILLSASDKLANGSRLLSSGSPLIPRTLDRSRSLDQWNLFNYSWALPDVLNSLPFIDLIILAGDIASAEVTTWLKDMVEAGRIDTVMLVAYPTSLACGTSRQRHLIESLESRASRLLCPSAPPRLGGRGWRMQMRCAQGPFVVRMEFPTRNSPDSGMSPGTSGRRAKGSK